MAAGPDRGLQQPGGAAAVTEQTQCQMAQTAAARRRQFLGNPRADSHFLVSLHFETSENKSDWATCRKDGKWQATWLILGSRHIWVTLTELYIKKINCGDIFPTFDLEDYQMSWHLIRSAGDQWVQAKHCPSHWQWHPSWSGRKIVWHSHEFGKSWKK